MKCQKCRKYIGYAKVVTNPKKQQDKGKPVCPDCFTLLQIKEK